MSKLTFEDRNLGGGEGFSNPEPPAPPHFLPWAFHWLEGSRPWVRRRQS